MPRKNRAPATLTCRGAYSERRMPLNSNLLPILAPLRCRSSARSSRRDGRPASPDPRLALAHAVFDEEPAVVAGQALGFHFLPAGLQLGLVGAPLGLHLFQLRDRQLALGRFGLGRGAVKRTDDQQCSGEIDSDTHEAP